MKGTFKRGVSCVLAALTLMSSVVQPVALLLWRIIISITKAPDRIGFYIGVLIFLFFLGRLLCNVMVNLNLISFEGIHLPFGGVGSHIALIDYMLLGVMMSISRHRIERI